MKTNINNTSQNFDFSHYNPLAHINYISTPFLEWFIGFAEADGSWGLNGGRPCLTITQKEERILHYIRDNLGYGTVTKHGNYFRFYVSAIQDIERLTHLFNGNLVLEKTRARFSSWLAIKNLPLLHTVPHPALENGWLAGFIDGEGCFTVDNYKIGSRGKALTPSLRFLLDQKGEPTVLECISEIIVGGKINRRLERENMWRFIARSEKSHSLLQQYLKVHPLRSYKRRAASCFFTLRRLINERKEKQSLVELCRGESKAHSVKI